MSQLKPVFDFGSFPHVHGGDLTNCCLLLVTHYAIVSFPSASLGGNYKYGLFHHLLIKQKTMQSFPSVLWGRSYQQVQFQHLLNWLYSWFRYHVGDLAGKVSINIYWLHSRQWYNSLLYHGGDPTSKICINIYWFHSGLCYNPFRIMGRSYW